jgi:hypothetical protein
MYFKEWLTESYNPRILLPYVNHVKDKRLGNISDHLLRMDYEEAMTKLYDLIKEGNPLPVLFRKVSRHYEITKDRMQSKARRDDRYMHDYAQSEPDNDLWLFVRALEDISDGNSPNLEELL